MTVGRAALLTAAGLALGFILLPLVLVSWLSFFRDEVVVFPPSGYTVRWFRAILDQRNFVDGFVTSLEVGVFAMLAGLALGVPASLCLTRYRFPGREGLGCRASCSPTSSSRFRGRCGSSPRAWWASTVRWRRRRRTSGLVRGRRSGASPCR